jgi:glycosyltransferase involved in cell wall biosynthesis
MKILFVAMAESIHTARWISQVADQGWDTYLFPFFRASPHPSLRDLTLFGCHPWRPANLDRSVHYKPWTSYFFYRNYIESRFKHPTTRYKEAGLAKAIQRTRPDIIHSIEFQHSAYLTMGAKKLISAPFPKWIATNWGSDIFLFGRMAEHKPKIQEVLSYCDYYSAECQRDVKLAQEMGLTGKVLPIFPNTGGFDLAHTVSLRQPGKSSSRRLILLKGYQHWAGRALSGLRALRLCSDSLGGYELAIYSASPDVVIAAQLFEQETGIPVRIIPQCSHEEMLRWYGRARIYIGLSISDAISTSLLESMVMGAFPIQSCTSCADEWISNGKSGLIVPPEDPDIIAQAILKALNDDVLVNEAAKINERVAFERLDQTKIRPQVIKMYQDIFEENKEKK